MHCVRREFEKAIFWSQTLRSWRIWTRQKPTLGDSILRRLLRRKMVKNFFTIADGTVKLSGGDQGSQRDGVLRACPKQATAHPRGSRTSVCANTFFLEWHTQGEEGRVSVLPVRRTNVGDRTGLPARVSGRHVERGTTVVTCPCPTAGRYRWP